MDTSSFTFTNHDGTIFWKNAENRTCLCIGKMQRHNSKKMGEVDFVTERNGKVLPIEVKSGKDYARHRALNNILDCSEYAIPEALVLCNDNLSTTGKVRYIPVYMVMFIHKEQTTDIQFNLDLSGLQEMYP